MAANEFSSKKDTRPVLADVAQLFPSSADYRDFHLQFFKHTGILEEYPRRKIIEPGGAPSNSIYVLVRGRVRQYFIDRDGTEKTLLLLSRGDLFGEITAFKQDNDQVITQTLTPAAVRRIPVTEFFRLLKQSGELPLSVTFMLSNKIRILMAQIQDSSFCNTEERLRNLLIRLSIQQGSETPDGIRIAQKFTHEELAGMISSTRSTVSRKMKLLVESGFIKIKEKHIYLSAMK